MTTAILMIHGLGGTAYDFGTLPAKLKQAGFAVQIPVLPGHGTRPHDLAQLTMEDWLTWAQEQYKLALQQHSTVHVVGMCMGALLACELAKTVPFKNGRLVMLAPTVYFDGWAMPWYHWLRHLHHVLPWARRWVKLKEEIPFGIKNKRLRALVQKRFLRGDSFHYAWLPLQSIWQLDRLRKKTLQNLSLIQNDTLVIHSQEDEFSSTRSALAIQNGILKNSVLGGGTARSGTPTCQVFVLENSYHMLCVDNDREAVAQRVLAFLNKTLM
jgi:carboxylesterase